MGIVIAFMTRMRIGLSARGWGAGHSSAVSAHSHATHPHPPDVSGLGGCREIENMALRPLPSVTLVVTFLFGYANGEFLPSPPRRAVTSVVWG